VLSAGIGLGRYEILLGIPALLAVGLALLRPHVFLGVSLVLYSLLQVALTETAVLEVGGLSVNGSQIYVLTLLALAALGMLVRVASGRMVLPPLPRSVRALGVLAVWLVVSLLPSEQPDIALASVARHVADLVALYLAYCLACQPGGGAWIRFGVSASTLIAAGSSILQSSLGSGNVVETAGRTFRAGGTFGGPVQTGTICLVGVAFFVSQLPLRSGRGRGLCLAAIAACALGMLATLSRTAILGVVLFSFFLACGRARRRGGRLRFLAYAAVTVLALALAIWVTPQESIESRTADLPLLGEATLASPTSGSGRTLIWRSTLDELADGTPAEWALGRGVNAVSLAIGRSIQVQVGAHNSYLQLLFDAGIVGLVLYLVGIVLVLRDLRGAQLQASGHAQESVRVWLYYTAAYFLSTEMFNAYVYILGPRFFTFLILGVCLALPRATEGTLGAHRRPSSA
jgi:O-antigen ligase